VVQSSRVPRGAGPGSVAEALAAHEGLVQWVVRRQWRGGLAFADALHEGRLGLWRAVRSYDPGRGTRFSSYAVPAIRHAVWAAVAREGALAQPPIAVPAAELGEADDLVEGVQRAQVQAAVRALVGQLQPSEQRVVVWHYGLDGRPPQTFAAIGRVLGVSRQRVHWVHRAALVVLAEPARSVALRRLVDRQRRVDYQQTLARQRQQARARRGRGRR
jgi:RNA polymerase sigma factor (sigma-70 family)